PDDRGPSLSALPRWPQLAGVPVPKRMPCVGVVVVSMVAASAAGGSMVAVSAEAALVVGSAAALVVGSAAGLMAATAAVFTAATAVIIRAIMDTAIPRSAITATERYLP